MHAKGRGQDEVDGTVEHADTDRDIEECRIGVRIECRYAGCAGMRDMQGVISRVQEDCGRVSVGRTMAANAMRAE